MTSPEKTQDSNSGSAVSLAELQQSHRSLRTSLNLVALSLLILIGGLSILLLRDVSQARRQLKELTQVVDNYTTNSRPAMLEIRDRLFEFAKTHPDYSPTFVKYFNPANTPASAPLPASGPADSTASPIRMPNLPEK